MKALITGITGQDAAYLSKMLLQRGFEVVGVYRRLSSPNFWRLKSLGIYDSVKLVSADLIDGSSLIRVVREEQPDHIYNLAAQSFVETSFEQPILTGEVNAIGTLRALEAMRLTCPDAHFYQASTSELYGNTSVDTQSETTCFSPKSPYAVSKLYAYWIVRNYRDAYSLFATNGILFNHESPLRGLQFITRKVSNAAVMIKLGLTDSLEVGNLDAARDWGYAPEYVESMYAMLNHHEPDDFVIATGEKHTVRELIETAFGYLKLDWQDYVKVSAKYLRPADVNSLRGNPEKARKILGWTPKTKFAELVRIMVDEDLRRWKEHLAGRFLYWDALGT